MHTCASYFNACSTSTLLFKNLKWMHIPGYLNVLDHKTLFFERHFEITKWERIKVAFIISEKYNGGSASKSKENRLLRVIRRKRDVRVRKVTQKNTLNILEVQESTIRRTLKNNGVPSRTSRQKPLLFKKKTGKKTHCWSFAVFLRSCGGGNRLFYFLYIWDQNRTLGVYVRRKKILKWIKLSEVNNKRKWVMQE